MQNVLDQRITYHCLHRMVHAHEVIMENVISSGLNESEIRNVCAKVHVSIADRLDQTVKTLAMKKRDFVEAAIVAALDRADFIMQDTGLLEIEEEGGVLVAPIVENEAA